MTYLNNHQRGVTLIDLLIGMLMTAILSLGAMELLTANAKVTMQETAHSAAMSDSQQLFRVVSEFIKQAEICGSCTPAKTLTITYGSGTNPNPDTSLTQSGDSIQIDFSLPSGYKVWPNDVAPYDQPAVRINWESSTGELTVAHADLISNLSVATPENLVQVTQRSSRIINLDLWPLTTAGTRQGAVSARPEGGYELCVAAKPPIQDMNFKNPDDTGDLYHYRTAKVCGVVFPRNW